MSKHYDLIIIGAGAAGLSFLLALNERNYRGRVLVLEAESSFCVNKTWSFWLQDDMPGYLRALIKHQWPSWQLSYQDQSVNHSCPTQAYSSIDANDFFNYAEHVISKSDNVKLQFNAGVVSLFQERNIAKINTGENQYTANAVVDTRAKSIQAPQNALYQSFYGLEVKTKNKCFNENYASLMQALKHGELGTEFLYVLPYSPAHALIEYTCFSSSPVSASALKQKTEASLRELIKENDYQLIRHEHGTLPMFNIDNNLAKDNTIIINAGIAGGAMRASTGYCFQPIQRWAQALSESLCENQKLCVIRPIPVFYRFLDNIFLYVMTENKEMGPSILFNFAKGMGGPAFARFMSEKANLADFFKVILGMPKGIFIKGLFRSLSSRRAPRKK